MLFVARFLGKKDEVLPTFRRKKTLFWCNQNKVLGAAHHRDPPKAPVSDGHAHHPRRQACACLHRVRGVRVLPDNFVQVS